MINNALNSGILHGVALGDLGVKMCQLQYADDLLILTTSGGEDLRIIKLILYIFEGLIGLRVNSKKTCLFASQRNLSPHVSHTRIVHYVAGSLPITYVGIPVSGGRPKKKDWDYLLSKI